MKTLLFIFVLLFTTCLYSTIINVPADQPTIQAGINAAVDADTVLVQPGTYVENINYNGKNITVASLFLTTQDTTYISLTIIDGDSINSVVKFVSGEDSMAVLCGFTITNGNASQGGGIYCNDSSPNLDNVTITGNSAIAGGGIFCYESSPSLVNVTISDNSAAYGGGIFCSNSSTPSLVNVTISGNYAGYYGGGIYCWDSNPSLVNCILWNDSPEEIYVLTGSVTATYSDIQGEWPGSGNIDEDPLFVNPIEGDYHLTENSPCIDAGDPFFPPDPDGTRADMGAYYFHHIGGEEVFADFYADTTIVYMPLSVNFYDLSVDFNTEITTWLWDFDNNGTIDSYEQNPFYIYQNPGYFSVSLTVEDDIGSSNTMIKTDYITVYPPAYSGHIWHISLEGSDELGGNGSPEYPFATIQHGISVAENGDTVLVHQGTYPENINYNGKNIIIGSLFLTTQDTTYISQTIIDGNESGPVVAFWSGEDQSAQLTGFTLMRGSGCGPSPGGGSGGGILCGNSSPSLLNLLITDNSVTRSGGGICCYDSSPSLENVTISGNTAWYEGGGIYCYYNSSLSLVNVTISGNSARSGGGGIYCEDNSSLSFDPVDRCNIFLNYAGSGNDLYASNCPTIDVIVDTFTVLQPDEHFAYPIDNFTFDIINAKLEQVDQDLYVSPDGSNNNSGLTVDDPLLTISFALAKILPDITNPLTIHLSNGTYSLSGTGEIFPLYCRSYVSLLGEGEISTILAGEELREILFCDNDNNFSIENMTIQNGNRGIYCNYSSPNLENVIISNNSDGGVYCSNSSPSLIDVTVTGNSATYGGGIYCSNSSSILENVSISGNSASYGGGVYYEDSNPSLVNTTITGNSASSRGGGIYCHISSSSLTNVTISGNTANNSGGGIYCDNSSLSFDAVDRCNIFLNFANTLGCDLYADNCTTIDVIVDTFTVLQPDDYFAYPIDNFTFDILNAKLEQVDQDLYVSPEGSNNNSGLTVDDPLLTISFALAKILPDITNPLTIHLSNGTYSLSGTGEIFPLYCRSFISLLGEDEFSTILDGEGLRGILFCENDDNFSIENMTIQNGSAWSGGGIRCSNSSASLENVTITGNSARWSGGIYCDNSSPNLQNVTITGNSADYDGGGIYCNNSSPSLENVIITGNSANRGGGIYCHHSNPSIVIVTVSGNSADQYGGGIFCSWYSSPSLVNVTITGNSANYGGGIYCFHNSSPCLVNCILWNDTPQEICFSPYSIFDPSSISISYTDIQGGEAGIVTNNYGTVNWLEGNLDEDPLFVGTGEHPFMLQDLSPCVNEGIPDTTGLNLPEFDLAGNPRVYGGRIDMGAYENQNIIVNTDENLIPLITKLNQNYPNPFNPTTTINYSLKENSKVSLNIYNIKGQKVRTLIKDKLEAGNHSVIWYGKDNNGKSVSSGIYFYKLKTGNFEKTRKMILIK